MDFQPLITRKNTAWAMTVWVDWTEYRNSAMANDSEQYPSPLIHQSTCLEFFHYTV